MGEALLAAEGPSSASFGQSLYVDNTEGGLMAWDPPAASQQPHREACSRCCLASCWGLRHSAQQKGCTSPSAPRGLRQEWDTLPPLALVPRISLGRGPQAASSGPSQLCLTTALSFLCSLSSLYPTNYHAPEAQ